jgi:hypothetical protein
LKDNIVLDGDGFTLQGDGSPISVGIFIENRNNVTVRNFIITDFNHGIDCIGSSSVQITHNSLTGNNIGTQTFYDIQETMIVVYNNSFLNNTFHVSPTSGFNWDNGKTGNFWSSYNGTDAHGDGIGDTPYIIDANNKDNYPLMLPINFTVDLYPTPQSTTTPSLSPTPSPTKSPSESPTQTLEPIPTPNKREDSFAPLAIVIGLVVAVAAVGLLFALAKHRESE